ncbi:late secretory pathway protein avl9 [Anaeramoeba flamelloides]|uniref:Late secretory pathway protein avl9 n=1 Tax=Anaeramoeba flamelloides TaxID=1746091 RepID=A0AAV7YDI7_9EUKA|nr:late secretory pathway protein avl9 [Anaeramoeba flamelloides]
MTEAIPFIAICNFDEEVGSEIEYFSPMPTSKKDPDFQNWLKKFSLFCLPTGSHRTESGFLFFNVYSPPPIKPRERLYGVSCFRLSTDNDRLAFNKNETSIQKKNKKKRRVLQKAVVVLSRLPLYRAIESKLSIITRAFFEQENHQDRSLVTQIHRLLNSSFTREKIENIEEEEEEEQEKEEQKKEEQEEEEQKEEAEEEKKGKKNQKKNQKKLKNKNKNKKNKKKKKKKKKKTIIVSDLTEQLNMSLPIRDYLPLLDKGLGCLTLLKFIMCEKKLLFYSQSPSAASHAVVTLLSLLPKFYYSLIPQMFQNEIDRSLERKRKKYDEKLNLPLGYPFDVDFGFPLDWCHKQTFWNPYSIDEQLEKLCRIESVTGFVVGTSTPLFVHKAADLGFDVVINLDDHKQRITYLSKDNKLLSELTKTEKNFIKNIMAVAFRREYTEGQWEGSDDWIRKQFSCYLQRLVIDLHRFTDYFQIQSKNSKNKNSNSNSPKKRKLHPKEVMNKFGKNWVISWKQTKNFKKLKKKILNMDMEKCYNAYKISDFNIFKEKAKKLLMKN